MGQFVASIVFAVIGIALFIASLRKRQSVAVAVPSQGENRKPRLLPKPGRLAMRISGVAVAVLGFLFLLGASLTSVGTKNVAVLTIGGRPSGYLTNGYHWKAPWATVHELNDAVQTDTYASDGGAQGRQQDGAVGTCISVRIARQATACVNVSIRWQIRPSGVDYLFRNFKDNSAITDNVVLRDLQQAMNESFIDYDPLGIDANGNSTNEPLSTTNGRPSLSTDVLHQMQQEIGTYIDVQSVIIPLLNFDASTQDRINQLQQQVALTRVAQQAKLTAEAQAAANRALAASVSKDPNVLTAKCLDILQDAVNKGQALPAGFSCFGDTSTSIAVPAK
jgi:regulator of protease activity HflC (stomatin/prohibitin superfamily)